MAPMITRLHEQEAALYAIYLTLVGQYHPDVAEEPREVAEVRLRKFEDAYEVLRDALRNIAPKPALPSKRDSVTLRQSQAALAWRNRKRKLELMIFALIIAALAATLTCCIMDIQHRLA